MTLDLADVMDGLAGLLDTAGVADNAYAWPVEAITPTAAIVGYPSRWDYDLTFRSGAETAVLPVWYVVGRTSDTTSRDRLGAAMAATGTGSVKAALDGGQSFGDVRVESAEVTELTVAGVAYLAAKFDCEVVG